ncbi:HD domain-containing protein [Campylobacter sp. VBCF_06 NA8]|uniref:HD domain-containing protein n=1 Tax=Campylobacter sp. VBCF_06 NA8 TaxID=2983822 RepID=UPI0022E99D01|nr:HD domain-containing protein [Campylobacter sp. VBCF_06 NA8]MDA3046795.1 HD domain-containing protein [Campylobacter sp. VBCF_06 NA8]
MLNLKMAKDLISGAISQPNLIAHCENVMAAMGAMAEHFGEDKEYWQAIGYLHDFDYEKFPDEHLAHTAGPLLDAGVDEASVRAILSHGYGICTDVEPISNLEKSLFCVDELTGIIDACAKMRPNGFADLGASSVMKKFKDKKFAAKCDRSVILKGCEMLGMDIKEVVEICIKGMRELHQA